MLVQINLGSIVKTLGCDNIKRRRMEANMLSLYRGSGPAFRAQMPHSLAMGHFTLIRNLA